MKKSVAEDQVQRAHRNAGRIDQLVREYAATVDESADVVEALRLLAGDPDEPTAAPVTTRNHVSPAFVRV